MSSTSKSQIKRIHFSQEEDEALRLLIQKYGESEWGLIASEMPNRSVRQCRERWNNHLKNSIQKRKWSHEEDELLKLKYSELGPKWKLMEPFFPGRTSINIRNRFSCLRRFNEIYNQNINNYYQTQPHESPSPISSPQSIPPIKQNDIKNSFDEEQPEFSEQFDDNYFDWNFGLEFLYDC